MKIDMIDHDSTTPNMIQLMTNQVTDSSMVCNLCNIISNNMHKE